jgi:hypothetical protein
VRLERHWREAHVLPSTRAPVAGPGGQPLRAALARGRWSCPGDATGGPHEPATVMFIRRRLAKVSTGHASFE